MPLISADALPVSCRLIELCERGSLQGRRNNLADTMTIADSLRDFFDAAAAATHEKKKRTREKCCLGL